MKAERQEDNLIVKLTFEFAISIINYTEQLQNDKRFVVANQLLKSGTSIGANVREAQNAESKQDFIHKFKIAVKEADETQYWLELCKYSKHYPATDALLGQLDSIMKVLNKIISTSKRKTSLLADIS